jgi:hypothetical protein
MTTKMILKDVLFILAGCFLVDSVIIGCFGILDMDGFLVSFSGYSLLASIFLSIIAINIEA